MRNRPHVFVNACRNAAKQFGADGASFLAQAIAFNVLFAAIPLTLIVVATFGYVYGTAAGDTRALTTIDRFAPQLYDAVANNLPTVVQYRGISGAIGLLGLVWSGKNIFGAVAYGLDRSLGIPSRHFVIEIAIGVILVPLLGIILIVATIVPVVITNIVPLGGLEYLRYGPQIGSYLFSLFFVFAMSWLAYTYLPNRRARPWFGVPGAAITAIGYSIAQTAFAVYTTHTNVLQIYGTLSAIFALMLWAYYVCMIFLYGAHVSAQWERETASEEHDAVAAAPPLAS